MGIRTEAEAEPGGTSKEGGISEDDPVPPVPPYSRRSGPSGSSAAAAAAGLTEQSLQALANATTGLAKQNTAFELLQLRFWDVLRGLQSTQQSCKRDIDETVAQVGADHENTRGNLQRQVTAFESLHGKMEGVLVGIHSAAVEQRLVLERLRHEPSQLERVNVLLRDTIRIVIHEELRPVQSCFSSVLSELGWVSSRLVEATEMALAARVNNSANGGHHNGQAPGHHGPQDTSSFAESACQPPAPPSVVLAVAPITVSAEADASVAAGNYGNRHGDEVTRGKEAGPDAASVEVPKGTVDQTTIPPHTCGTEAIRDIPSLLKSQARATAESNGAKRVSSEVDSPPRPQPGFAARACVGNVPKRAATAQVTGPPDSNAKC